VGPPEPRSPLRLERRFLPGAAPSPFPLTLAHPISVENQKADPNLCSATRLGGPPCFANRSTARRSPGALLLVMEGLHPKRPSGLVNPQPRPRPPTTPPRNAILPCSLSLHPPDLTRTAGTRIRPLSRGRYPYPFSNNNTTPGAALEMIAGRVVTPSPEREPRADAFIPSIVCASVVSLDHIHTLKPWASRRSKWSRDLGGHDCWSTTPPANALRNQIQTL